MAVSCLPWGELPDGRAVHLYVLSHPGGITAGVMTYGSTLVFLHMPDRAGRCADVVLGFSGLAGYLGAHPYFGVTVGRYANRIARGRFTLDGVRHQLACNDGPHHLHGGSRGFDRRLWRARRQGQRVVMTYVSPDGDEGYPGQLTATASYAVTPTGEFIIDYTASCDRPTLVNLTNHAYFNLGGAADDTIHDHVLELPGTHFLPVDDGLIPTGEVRAVAGSCMDFTRGARLGDRLSAAAAELVAIGGYDHTWTVMPGAPAARLSHPRSGRVLTICTTQPGVQFYSGHQLDGSLVGKGHQTYVKHAGLCLEPHCYPDAPNHPHFPSARLLPGERYTQRTIYRCTVHQDVTS